MWSNCDGALLRFPEGLHPSKEHVENGISALENVLEFLKTQRGTYRIARICYSGSIAKKTALANTDFDCVLFVNGVNPEGYKAVLEEFEDFLYQKKRGISGIRKTRFSIQFRLNGEFDVDLLVAKNLVVNVEHRAGRRRKSIMAEQRERALKLIAAKPSDYYLFNSCLAESQVEFMKLQSSFVHKVVKLCKYWLKAMELGPYVSGVKSVIEMIAVDSAQRYEKNGILKTFRSFLMRVVNLSSVKICFLKNGKGLRRVAQKFNRPQSQIHKLGIPRSILGKRGFILEPANPFNDLTQNIYNTRGLPEKLMEKARKTFGLFVSTKLAGVDDPDFERIFENLEI